MGQTCLGKASPAQGHQLGAQAWAVVQALAEGGRWRDSPRCSWTPAHHPPRTSPPSSFSVPCTVGRKQFMHFESASHAAEALGCEYEELNTATFKHHLRQIIERMTSGPSRRGQEDEGASSGTALLPLWVGCVPAGPAPGDTPAPFHCPLRIS